MMVQKEDSRTKEKYEAEQVNLSIDWNTGHIQRNAEGEPVLDDDGNTQIHYINDGFVTFSGDKRANLVKILKAIGFDTPEFIEQDGNNEGGLRDDLDVELQFGENGLGHDYEGADYDELPFYVLPSKGGQERKRDVEVPVLSFKINGQEVIGRAAELIITEKNGWNRIESYIPLEDEDQEANSMAQTVPATPKPTKRAASIEEREPDATDKGAKYVQRILEETMVPREDWTPVIRYVLSKPELKNTASIEVDDARTIRDMFKEDPSILKSAYDALQIDTQPAEDDFEEEFPADEEF